jgi:hypothetical protein
MHTKFCWNKVKGRELGIPSCKWKDSIRRDLKRYRVERCDLLIMVMNLQVP